MPTHYPLEMRLPQPGLELCSRGESGAATVATAASNVLTLGV